MSTQIFTLTNLNDLLSYFSAVNVIDLDPCEVQKYLLQEYASSIGITGAQLTQEMMNAIASHKMEDFRHRYCEAPFLIIHLTEEDVCKPALQHELVFFLNVRQYKKLPTVLLSKDRLTAYPIANESLIGYAHVYESIRK